MKKRLLALLTALALTLSTVPSVFADDATTEETTTEETVTTVDGFSEIMAVDYYLVNGNPIKKTTSTTSYVESIDSWYGMIYKSLDFGEGADTIILDVKSADIYKKTGKLKFMIGSTTDELVDADGDGKADVIASTNKPYGESGTLLATAANYQTSTALTWKLHHYVVDNASSLKGVLNINLLASGAYGNIHSFQFNKAVSPYAQLLTEEVTTGKEIKSLYFDGNGATSIDLDYTGTGTLSIYKDTMNGTDLSNLVTTIELDGTTTNFAVDNAEFTGATDLYFAVTGGVSLSGVEFNEKPDDAYETIYAKDYDYYRNDVNGFGIEGNHVMMKAWTGMLYDNIDFGEGADEMVLDVFDAGYGREGRELWFKVTTEEHSGELGDSMNDYIQGGTLVATATPSTTSGWSDYNMKHYLITDTSALKGVVNLNVFTKSLWNNLYKFQFNKAVNPYAQLLTDETIESAKEIKSMNFSGNGAQSVIFDYAVTEGAEAATVTVYNDTINGTTNMTAVDTFELDLGATTKTIKLDATNYQGVKDLYFVVSGVTVSGIAFEELGLVDPFATKDVSALYIGNSAKTDGDWSEIVKAEYEGALAYYEKNYTDEYVDLSAKSDVEYLDFLANIPTADIVFVQAGDKAETILAELAKLETKPFTVVIGEASYAADYGIRAVTTGADAFCSPETYVTPTALEVKNPYTTGLIMKDADEKSGVGLEGNHINKINAHDYVMFEDVDFNKGISAAVISYAHTQAYASTKISVRLGSTTGQLIASYTGAEATGDFYTYKEFDMDIESVYGVHDVYVVSDGNFGNLYSVKFTQDTNIDATAGLNAINGTVSENADIADNTLIIAQDDTVTYTNVDFGATEQLYYVDAEVAVSEDADGILYIKDADDTVVKYDLTQIEKETFTTLSEMTNGVISGEKTLTVSYQGTGKCYIKAIGFKKPLAWNDELSYTNYSADLTTAPLVTDHFEKMDYNDTYVVWEKVDFTGSEEKLLTLKAIVALADGYDGGYLTVRADAANGPIVARVALTATGGATVWNVQGEFTAPVVAKLTGLHDLYVSVDNGPDMEKNKAGNVYNITFVENTTDTIVNSYWVDMESKTVKQDMNSAVAFKNSDADLTKFVLVTAVYGANGLVGIDYDVCDAIVGVNTALSTVPASALEAAYTVKTFLWNADTLKPIMAEAITNENVTAE